MENKININDISFKDKVIIDGKKYGLYRFGKDLQIKVKNYFEPLKDYLDDIESIDKYHPVISFGGSFAYLNEFVKNEADELIYLKISGQEQHIRAISSVIMQGLKFIKDDILYSEEIASFQIIPNGNKRIIKSFGDGIVDCIVYNYDNISGQNRKVLIGENEDDIYLNFLSWLKSSVKYPTFKEMNKDFFISLKEKNLIKESTSLNVLAYDISEELICDDFKLFREIQLDLVKHLRVEEPEVIELPKSAYLTEKQVSSIYEVLSTLPEPYSTDGQKIKPVGLKLFGPSLTYYIVESNKGDEYYKPYSRCFAYVKNEANPEYSEWGWVNVNEIIETKIPLKMVKNGESAVVYIGFEMDLYFKNKMIDRNGEIISN